MLRTGHSVLQFVSAFDGNLAMLPELLFDLKEVEMQHGVNGEVADAYCPGVDAAVYRMWEAIGE